MNYPDVLLAAMAETGLKQQDCLLAIDEELGLEQAWDQLPLAIMGGDHRVIKAIDTLYQIAVHSDLETRLWTQINVLDETSTFSPLKSAMASSAARVVFARDTDEFAKFAAASLLVHIVNDALPGIKQEHKEYIITIRKHIHENNLVRNAQTTRMIDEAVKKLIELRAGHSAS